jgi:hypothetical protein
MSSIIVLEAVKFCLGLVLNPTNRDRHRLVLHLIIYLLDFRGPIFDTAIAQSLNFEPVLDADGSAFCATNKPTTVFTISAIAGIPDGVPAEVRCGFGCGAFANCSSFNYKASTPVGICELFNYIPRNCTSRQHGTSLCYHYQVFFRSRARLMSVNFEIS